MSYYESKKLREERGEIVHQMHELAKQVKSEERDFTSEELEKWDHLEADERSYTSKIDTVERLERANSLVTDKEEVQEQYRSLKPRSNKSEQVTQRDWELALRGAAFRNTDNFTEEMDQACRKLKMSPSQGKVSFRAQSTDATQGGNTAGNEPIRGLEQALLSYGGLNSVATTISTATGNTLPYPTVNTTGQTASIIGENTEVTNTSVTFSQVTYGAFKYATLVQPVSLELMQDSSVNMMDFISNALVTRIARAQADDWVNGDGTGEPRGFLLDSSNGKTSDGTGVISYDDLVDLQASIDAAYDVNSVWLMNRSSEASIKKLVDDQSRPLWLPNLVPNSPTTLLGKPIVIDEAMPDIANAATPIAYGDFSKYIIRRVSGVDVRFLQERYMDLGAVGVIAFARADGALIDAGTNPVKHMTITGS
ncbi:phage major capsid protein [Gimesia maris]|uniref:phage major capsid protein n=1 Tax=Gimesia maris TaxID=122 RepID=UPI0030DC181D|tara:strand:- start:124262 stop:125530 length:1269 start_codon:yes stop_codon:yes gene_type:complete